jgi:peptidoglycan/xylan/chitin deacetylase (PgdA/CDA1 family)
MAWSLFFYAPKTESSSLPPRNFTPRNATYFVAPLPPKVIAQNVQLPVISDYCLTVPVLFYHHVQPNDIAVQKNQTSLNVDSGIFDQQMAYLSGSGYNSISADQLISAIKNHSGLPPKTVVITFDDGYMDNYTYAYPVLQKYHLVGNIMVITGLLENSDMLGWAQLKDMVGSGTFNAYDHTWSHASLAGLAEDKVQSEIMTAKSQLESNLGKSVDIFTYPYGSENGEVQSLLSQDGFVGAFSTIGGTTQCESFIMSLHRTRIGNSSLSSYGI